VLALPFFASELHLVRAHSVDGRGVVEQSVPKDIRRIRWQYEGGRCSRVRATRSVESEHITHDRVAHQPPQALARSVAEQLFDRESGSFDRTVFDARLGLAFARTLQARAPLRAACVVVGVPG
jgi:hypothetical protein